MRSAITGKLRQFARDLGVTGGIITHQMSPWKTRDYRRGVSPGITSFRHDYTLLGEVTFADQDQSDNFRDTTAYCTHPFGVIHIKHADLANCYQSAGILWSFHPADDPTVDALRLFLAGSSTDYPVGKLEWHAGGVTEGRIARNGVRGALALSPHFMMDEVQWWSYAEATHGLPPYVPFGTWRSAIGEAKHKRRERQRASVLLAVPGRAARYRRHQGLQRANRERKQAAKKGVATLLEVATPLFKQVLAESSGKRGRPAHRVRLKKLLEEKGYRLSDHHLKQVMRALRPSGDR